MPLIFIDDTRTVTFEDARVQAIRDDEARLTSEEREFLVEHVPSYPTCDRTAADMRKLPDSDIMEVAYWTMDEFAKGVTLLEKL